jgi:UDP-2-acetamido-2-deoxy-ribo-hexuluronate aminotransferase
MNQHAVPAPIPFIDVAAQRRRLGRAVDEAVARVMAHCQFVMGPEVAALEADLATFCGARYAISCASGTDALMLVLMAKGVGAGDAVLVPAFTYAATAEAVALVGATPVFADVDQATFNVTAETLGRALAAARTAGLKPKGAIPVDLFGLPADHAPILDFARASSLFVLDDAAQGFGGTYKSKRLGTFGLATATSFFPAKPLGCYGDGGAVFTDDDELAALLRSLRFHGEGVDRSEHVRIGMTGRLDTIQAAVLIEKLKIFADEIAARNRAAGRYREALTKHVTVPQAPADRTSVWAQYTIRLPNGKRDVFAAALKADGIPTAIHYRRPMHRQPAYARFPVADGGLPVSERLAEEVISLPMHAYLDAATQDRVIAAVKRAAAG